MSKRKNIWTPGSCNKDWRLRRAERSSCFLVNSLHWPLLQDMRLIEKIGLRVFYRFCSEMCTSHVVSDEVGDLELDGPEQTLRLGRRSCQACFGSSTSGGLCALLYLLEPELCIQRERGAARSEISRRAHSHPC